MFTVSGGARATLGIGYSNKYAGVRGQADIKFLDLSGTSAIAWSMDDILE